VHFKVKLPFHETEDPLQIFKVGEDTTVQEVADTMIKSHIHRVFVTREEKVVGIILTGDKL